MFNFDKNVSVIAESTARKVSRRKALSTTVKGMFAAVSALAVGQFMGRGDAEAAVNCGCGWIGGSINANCPGANKSPQGGCPAYGCPVGCVTCTTVDGCGGCVYGSGYWVACSNLGTCGLGYKVCRDCKCGATCGVYNCTCLSDVYCKRCCKQSDVEAEMIRIDAEIQKVRSLSA